VNIDQVLADLGALFTASRLRTYAARFASAFVVAFGSCVSTAGIHAWSWSLLAGVASGAAVAALETVWPSIPWSAVLGKLRAAKTGESPAVGQ
jgi:hypothetical protein